MSRPTAPTPGVRVEWHEYGDAGLLLDFAGGDYEARWLAAQSLGAALRAVRPTGFTDVVASFQSVFVSFDPLATDHVSMRSAMAQLLGQEPEPYVARRLTIPVVYGGEMGPDLDEVSRELGTDAESVVRLHVSADWVVRFVASPVGAPLMDGPRLPASVARSSEPRSRVEPGSVGVSGFQSIIYPAPSPGGWRLIGRTPATLFDLDRPPHVPYRPGDLVRFRRIEAAEWDGFRGPPAAQPLEPTEPPS
jgi:KipI family sensor histidine kinase inhibitor